MGRVLQMIIAVVLGVAAVIVLALIAVPALISLVVIETIEYIHYGPKTYRRIYMRKEKRAEDTPSARQ